ncbi:hypothetical protein COV17_02365 [Candidatus Woesearchaeota archaeon CG10_big_fil_rev_8_21_14_0_10_36_11]|nr:MAG: hypothetical protein COV17_02365 [Candidatus Woesearchaeota archaeon CG10_big_fil_rev_8_21_14_0_10_36_11]
MMDLLKSKVGQNIKITTCPEYIKREEINRMPIFVEGKLVNVLPYRAVVIRFEDGSEACVHFYGRRGIEYIHKLDPDNPSKLFLDVLYGNTEIGLEYPVSSAEEVNLRRLHAFGSANIQRSSLAELLDS